MIHHQVDCHESQIIQGHDCYAEALGMLSWESYSAVFVVSQDVIWQLHGQKLIQALEGLAPKVQHYLMPDGEAIKSLASFELLHHWLADQKADRKSLLIVLGGGVIGDLTGFVAATYMRGIHWVYLPTTLLAQQDASVGGKVAVNLPHGKNLVGRFWHPQAVILDTTVLSTLPNRQIHAGYMELLKHGMLGDRQLLKDILQIPVEVTDWQEYGELLWRGLQIKVEIVKEDPFEKNRRRLLNLGHTFGHALESAFAYRGWLHGEAVGVGLLFAVALAQQINSESQWPQIMPAVKSRLPAFDTGQWHRDELLELTRLDKKGIAGDVPWIVPKGPGQIEIINGIKIETLERAYSQLMEWLEQS